MFYRKLHHGVGDFVLLSSDVTAPTGICFPETRHAGIARSGSKADMGRGLWVAITTQVKSDFFPTPILQIFAKAPTTGRNPD